MGFQLNVNFVFANGGSSYVYWIQDVAQVDTKANVAYIIDNVWNFTAPKASISSSGISGNGTVDKFNGTGFYYDIAGGVQATGIQIPIPSTISFLVATGLDKSHRPTVSFEYSIGSGYTKYDTVTFTSAHNVSSLTGFEVNGQKYNPAGLFYDAELVLGGPGGGQTTAIVSSDVRLTLNRWNGFNFQAVSNAVNFGADTAETISNASSKPFYAEETGQLFARIQGGTVSLGPLYGENQVGSFRYSSYVVGQNFTGVLYVSNSTTPWATPMQVPFSNGFVAVVLHPGTYLLQVFFSDSQLDDAGNGTVTAGQTLNLNAPLGFMQLTYSYSVIGGSAGFEPPTFSYLHNGILVKSFLTTTPKIYYVDYNSLYSISSNYTSGDTRWITRPPAMGEGVALHGKAFLFFTYKFIYFHQDQVEFHLAVKGGGNGYSDPNILITQLGLITEVSTGTRVWADVAPYSHPTLLTGSSASERWISLEARGNITAPGNIALTYFHQFGLTFNYEVVGGESPQAPTFAGTSLGKVFFAPLANSSVKYFLDPGTTWSVPSLLPGSDSQQRWIASSLTNGTVQQSSTILLTYIHQFAVSSSVSPTEGGATNLTVSWESAGSLVHITEFANQGWQFEGWNGSGAGSYTGSSPSAAFIVGSPVFENATFYPGLQISAGSYGMVYYSFGTHRGIVSSGTSVIVFAPKNTELQLMANASSFFYIFAGWSPNANSAVHTTSFKLDSPTTVTATFSVNNLLIGEIGAGVIAAVAAVTTLAVWSRRRRNKK